jgi:predicted ATPase
MLLQAASVIGRRFNPELLAVAAGETEIDEPLAAMQALDLIHLDDRSSDYIFKHALVRDALYQGVLTERRQGLHSKIAEEIERRSSNRLAEVAEVLAHHYSQTNHTAKALIYLSMAGSRSLGVYSLEEAANYFTAALALTSSRATRPCASPPTSPSCRSCCAFNPLPPRRRGDSNGAQCSPGYPARTADTSGPP